MNNQFIRLGVNIDHVATIRQARGTRYPDPIYAAQIAEQNGADGITLHVREDRRHIQDRDLHILKETIQTRINLEMAVTDEMVAIACELQPDACCLVPEKREELTTEGGLNVIAGQKKIEQAIKRLYKAGIEVSLFIDPDEAQIQAAVDCGAPVIEIHTGRYAEATDEEVIKHEFEIIQKAVRFAQDKKIQVNAGHGLHYHNVMPIAAIPEIVELNIGHAIVARAVLDGFANAVRDMKALMYKARYGN